MFKNIFSGNQKLNGLFAVSPVLEKEVEEWVVNSLKVKMIRKLENLLEDEGKQNARKVFLVPIFSLEKLIRHVSETAPEMKTLFYKELVQALEDVEVRFSPR